MRMEGHIFVFGSADRGDHNSNANSIFAARYCGALRGEAEGLHGRSYAIPTFNGTGKPHCPETIRTNVKRFLRFAGEHPELKFQIARFGTENSWNADAEMAGLFSEAPPNCVISGVWLSKLGRLSRERLIVAGNFAIDDLSLLERIMDDYRSHALLPLSLVSARSKGADMLAEAWAKRCSRPDCTIPVIGFPVMERDWSLTRYGQNAGHVRYGEMIWYATHLLAICTDAPLANRDTGMSALIEKATEADLTITSIGWEQVEAMREPPVHGVGAEEAVRHITCT